MIKNLKINIFLLLFLNIFILFDIEYNFVNLIVIRLGPLNFIKSFKSIIKDILLLEFLRFTPKI